MTTALDIRIRSGREGAVAILPIDRPDTRNALSRGMFEQLRAEVAGFAADENVRALLLTGSGDAFCSGADLTDPMMGRGLPRDGGKVSRSAAAARRDSSKSPRCAP